jgi:hypothetical protein
VTCKKNNQKRKHVQQGRQQTQPRHCKTREEARTLSAHEPANTEATSSQIPNTSIAMTTVYSGMPTRPGHVTLSILVVAFNVAVMSKLMRGHSTQYRSSAPFLCQLINGATHAAGNRETGLEVSHDQFCCIGAIVSACLLQLLLQQEAGSAVQQTILLYRKKPQQHCRASSSRHAIIKHVQASSRRSSGEVSVQSVSFCLSFGGLGGRRSETPTTDLVFVLLLPLPFLICLSCFSYDFFRPSR